MALSNAILEDVKIIFRNFSGKEGQYNREGDRNFSVILSPEQAKQMEEDGWNVKYLKPRDEDDEPTPYIQVAVNFKGKARPPRVVMISSRGRTTLGEEDVSILDWTENKQVDLIFRPYEWAVNGSSGVKAYLQSIYVTIIEDELEIKYADVQDSAASSIMEDPND